MDAILGLQLAWRWWRGGIITGMAVG